MRKILVALCALFVATPAVAQLSTVNPPIDPSTIAYRGDVDAATAAISTLSATTPRYIANGAFISRATLYASYPCTTDASVLGKLARINDAFGRVSTSFICETDTIFGPYWRPQRTDYSDAITQVSGTVTLSPTSTAPIVYFPNPPTANMTIATSTDRVWPGATFHVYMPATITLPVTVTISGLVGGGTLPAVQGRDYTITYVAGQGWKSN